MGWVKYFLLCVIMTNRRFNNGFIIFNVVTVKRQLVYPVRDMVVYSSKALDLLSNRSTVITWIQTHRILLFKFIMQHRPLDLWDQPLMDRLLRIFNLFVAVFNTALETLPSRFINTLMLGRATGLYFDLVSAIMMGEAK